MEYTNNQYQKDMQKNNEKENDIMNNKAIDELRALHGVKETATNEVEIKKWRSYTDLFNDMKSEGVTTKTFKIVWAFINKSTDRRYKDQLVLVSDEGIAYNVGQQKHIDFFQDMINKNLLTTYFGNEDETNNFQIWKAKIIVNKKDGKEYLLWYEG